MTASILQELSPQLRQYTSKDEGYVVVSWISELLWSRTYQPLRNILGDDHAFRLLRPHVLSHLADPALNVMVCHPDGEPSTILGFIVAAQPVLYHLHVKGRFRGLGLSSWMMDQLGFCQTETVIAATDTRDLRVLISSGHPIALRRDLLPIQISGAKR